MINIRQCVETVLIDFGQFSWDSDSFLDTVFWTVSFMDSYSYVTVFWTLLVTLILMTIYVTVLDVYKN